MRLTKIYTKVGDGGLTSLSSGVRVSKSDLRIEAYGTVDELNAFIGSLKDQIQLAMCQNQKEEILQGVSQELLQIQNELFDIGGELSFPQDFDTSKLNLVGLTEIARLESSMDSMNASLKPLANFVLPGGHLINSSCHISRTVCRRAERVIVHLSESSKVRSEIQIYLNRLSDWLFVTCRFLSMELAIDEVLWDQKK
jgi:cob(I)alamin adenosyltransferase